MRLTTSLPFPHLTFKHWSIDDREVAVLIVKGTFAINADGSLAVIEDQPEIVEVSISTFGRSLEHYNLRNDAVVLEGIGTPNYVDNYTVRNRSVVTEGNRPQWVIGEEFRPTTADIERTSLTWREHPENRDWVENEDGTFTSDEGTIRPVQVPDRNDPSRTLTFWEMVE